MFLLGLNDDEINWENPDYYHLKGHLYRVQKTSQNDYSFRYATTSSVNNKIEEKRMGIKGIVSNNVIKVKISVSGKIQKI